MYYNIVLDTSNMNEMETFNLILEKIDVDSIITKAVNLKEIKKLVDKNTFIAEICL